MSQTTQLNPDIAADRRSDYLETLLQLSRTLNSSLDVEQVLTTAIQQVVQFVGAERGFILLVDVASKKVWGKVALGIDPTHLEAFLAGRDKSNRPEISRSIIDETLKTRCAVVSLNAMDDPRFSAKDSVQLANVRSVLCVPLIVQDQCLGILYLDNRAQSGVFDEGHQQMLIAFANQAAVAIQNARLYDNLRRSLEEKLQLQAELHQQETQRRAAEEASRMKTEFIGYVTHELRNPLTTMRGFVQTMLADTEGHLDAATRTELHETIEAEADRMLDLINELLDSSRLEAGRPVQLHTRKFDLKALLTRLAHNQKYYKFWKEGRHSMVLEIAPDLPDIEADEDKVHQIVANLLTNAIKYSPDGGEVRLVAERHGDGVRILVQDHGVGMTEEQCGRLFKPFERLDREEIRGIAGTGLGLYLMKHLVDLHGGSLTCRSQAGEGSTFSLCLPLTQQSIHHTATDAAA
jgi:signal transduction histidine kinase